MKAQDKIDLVKLAVISEFENKSSIDEICGKIVGTPGIKFSEIHGIVKYIGESEGFIVSMKKRKELAITDIQAHIDFELSFDDLEAVNLDISAEFDVPISWVRSEMKKLYKDNEKFYPKKSTLCGWKLQMVECFKMNPDATAYEVTRCLENSEVVKNPEHYVRDFYEFAKALAAI